MAIHVLSKERVFQLDTAHSSYQLAVGPCGYLLHLWYGAKLPAEDLLNTVNYQDIGFSGNPVEANGMRTISPDTLPMECPGFGCGDYRDASICLRFPDGSRAADFRYESYEVVEGYLPIPGLPCAHATAAEPCQTLIIRLRERASRVLLEMIYGVYAAGDVITRSVRVVNEGAVAVELERCLSCSMDFMDGDFDVVAFPGKHIMERIPERTRVTHARTELYSLRGMSSHQQNPAMVLCRPETSETAGDCYGFCFVYSSNFVASAQMDQRGQTRVNMGIHPDLFCWHLEPGAAFDAPQVILSYSGEGFDGLSQRYHRFILDHICRSPWTHVKRPVLINSWEAAYFNFDRAKIVGLAKAAKAVGLDMLVMDDGWFGARDDDNAGLGDWIENTRKLGGTMGELAEAVRSEGVAFGLWIEPEMVNEDSDLYRAHPDWALTVPNRPPIRGREQLLLDMSRPEVVDYLYAAFCRVLDNAAIDYIKWDFNRSVSDVYSNAPGARQGEIAHRMMLGAYDLMGRLVERYPRLLLENCSGGGGRFDAGMMAFSPQIWCSDDTDAINRAMIQYGTSFFYPPKMMSSHVSVCPNHQTGRTTPMETRFNVALTGAWGYELDITKLSDSELDEIRAQLAAWREIEPIVREGTYHRLSGIDGHHIDWMFVAPDQSRAVVFTLMLTADGNEVPVRVHPRGLQPDAMYTCRELNQTHSGAAWMRAGMLTFEQPRQFESHRYVLEKQ